MHEATETGSQRPKYVFLFIGDGMGPSQYQLANNYRYRMEQPDVVYLRTPKLLNFMNFPVVATVMTPDSTSFVPDSASTATAMAAGEKTHTMCVNTDEVGKRNYRPLTRDLSEDGGFRLGIVTTAFMNDATPAAFYASHFDRYDYYPISSQVASGNIDVFAGGGLVEPADPDGKGMNAWALLRERGYTICTTREEASALHYGDAPAYILAEDLGRAESVPYAIDRAPESWSLGQYLRKTMELLGAYEGWDGETAVEGEHEKLTPAQRLERREQQGPQNFFILCEGGKIDWACHNNSAGTMIPEVLDFEQSIEVALEFQARYPDETLILVTADHETGGLSQGYSLTYYMTYLENFSRQKMSHDSFLNDVFRPRIKEGKVTFEEMMEVVREYYGLEPPQGDEIPAPGSLILRKPEWEDLKEAFDTSLAYLDPDRQPTEREVERYNGYDPFVVTLNRIFNRKSGVEFATVGHTATPVTLFAKGPGAERFTGLIDNTDINAGLRELLLGH